MKKDDIPCRRLPQSPLQPLQTVTGPPTANSRYLGCHPLHPCVRQECVGWSVNFEAHFAAQYGSDKNLLWIPGERSVQVGLAACAMLPKAWTRLQGLYHLSRITEVGRQLLAKQTV